MVLFELDAETKAIRRDKDFFEKEMEIWGNHSFHQNITRDTRGLKGETINLSEVGKICERQIDT
jgi:hypothetical protein